jgi:HlyD family secretion protein
MRRNLKNPVIAVIVIVILGGFGVWWWRARHDPTVSFRTVAVKRGDVAATISSTGTIEPEEVVDVGAQVAGLITSFGKDKSGKTIDYGSVVEEGAMLAKIDESVYASGVALVLSGINNMTYSCCASERNPQTARMFDYIRHA